MQGATAKCSRVNFKARPDIQTRPILLFPFFPNFTNHYSKTQDKSNQDLSKNTLSEYHHDLLLFTLELWHVCTGSPEFGAPEYSNRYTNV